MRRLLVLVALVVVTTLAQSHLTPAHMVSTLRRIAECTSNDEVMRRRAAKWLRFYTAAAVSPHTSVHSRCGALIDCVDFELQPALLEARHHGDDRTVRDAVAAWRRVAGMTPPEPSMLCRHSDQVPVARPVIEAEDTACPRLRTSLPKKLVPRQPHPKSQPNVGSTSSSGSGSSPSANYEYVDGPVMTFGNASSSRITVALSSALGLAPPSVPADDTSHSINQLWWLTTAGLASNTVSLETGWIQSNYFTASSETTLFVFSTPDGYSNQTTDGPDSYNLAGGFVQYPGSPPVGVPMDEVLMALEYRVMANGVGYQLWFRRFTATRQGGGGGGGGGGGSGGSSSGSGVSNAPPFTNVTWTDDEWRPLGHYPMARYLRCGGVPSFAYFQVGSEMAAAPGANVKASGAILQWGQDGSSYTILGGFQAEGAYAGTYVGEVWNAKSDSGNDTVAVVFSGSNV